MTSHAITEIKYDDIYHLVFISEMKIKLNGHHSLHCKTVSVQEYGKWNGSKLNMEAAQQNQVDNYNR